MSIISLELWNSCAVHTFEWFWILKHIMWWRLFTTINMSHPLLEGLWENDVKVGEGVALFIGHLANSYCCYHGLFCRATFHFCTWGGWNKTNFLKRTTFVNRNTEAEFFICKVTTFFLNSHVIVKMLSTHWCTQGYHLPVSVSIWKIKYIQHKA